MRAFFIFGIADFQDLATSIIASLESNKVWVAIFDCLEKKNQFYYYEKEELINYVNSICAIKNKSNLTVTYYSKKCQSIYERDFKNKKPSRIFMQGIFHKYPTWMPKILNTPVVHYAWGADGLTNLYKSKYRKNVCLNVLRHHEDIKLFKEKTKIKSVYFGNLGLDSLNFARIGYEKINELIDEKVLFMPESCLKKDNIKWDKISVEQFIDPIINIAKELGFYIIVKRREKGYPTDKSTGYSNLLKQKDKIDLLIDKDLFFPSSLYGIPTLSNKIILIGQKTQGTQELINCYKKIGTADIMHVNESSYDQKKIENFLRLKNREKSQIKIKDKATEKLMRYLNDNLR
jgi:hypothetical protein